MSLITAHKILIGTAIAFFLFFAVWQLRAFLATGDSWNLFFSVMSAGVTVGWALYIRTIQPRDAQKSGRRPS